MVNDEREAERARERARVAQLMEVMADGDAAAMFGLIDEFGGRLAGVVKRHLFELGRRDVAADPAQLDYLVQSAALEIFDRAAGWRADGALPWTWADRAIRAEVVRVIGHPTVELDPAEHDGRVLAATGPPGPSGRSGPPAMGGTIDDFVALADQHEIVGLLREAIGEVGSDRDQAIHIQYRIQKRLGDVSPAHTLAAEFGLAPDNIRQIDHRMRHKLRTLVDRDDRFGSLRRLDWLAS